MVVVVVDGDGDGSNGGILMLVGSTMTRLPIILIMH